ncbi:MAG TPA: transporter [Candidatus Polarisedimenticolaceae bacterium]|nr:transporter [Candidatus Polarisedimenticolaceae bacterium]
MARPSRIGLLIVVLLASTCAASAQELEPRAYSSSPLGTNFFLLALGRSSGSVIFDPSIPITDVSAHVGSATAGYGRSYGIGGKQGLFTIAFPYAVAHVEGMVQEQAHAVTRSGLADLRLRASLNLIGGKAMSPAEFAAAPRKTVFGISVTVQAPTGAYDATKLVNLGTNRWAFKPELGVSVPVGHWYLEAYAGAWFFTNNVNFYPGTSVKQQDPLTSAQFHVAYTFKNRSWLALDGTWYGGGQVTLDDGPPSARFSNSRYGGTFSLPVAKLHSLKFAASKGASARTGSNFTTYLLAWQVLWFERGNP